MGQLSAVRRQLLMNVRRLICNGLVGRIEWKRSISAWCNVLWCNLCLTTLQACGKARFTLRSSRDLLSGKAANRRDEPNDFSSLDRASDQPIILARSAGRMVSGWRRCIHENLFDSNTR